jgi:dihydrofolate synthase/folylpolyglutamate synthase
VRSLGVDLGLGRVRDALARLGEPQRRFAAVQIAGTNGKGSTAAMTEALLRAAGLRTALYTSPHLARFTERIRVGETEADGDRLAALDAAVAATGVPLTYFEIATVLAFLYFAERGVDVAVLETGLGGRLDAVTACEPLATAITSIGIDHVEYLGGTLREIAREKAGIMKPGVPCFVGRLPIDADEEITSAAAVARAPLTRLGRDFAPRTEPLGLAGAHQADNAAIAVALARQAAARFDRSLPDGIVTQALAAVRWPGRLEWIGDDVLLDCAHNVDGARALATALDALPRERPRVLLMSIVGDKDVTAMLRMMSGSAQTLVLTRSTNPRALAPDVISDAARPFFAQVVVRDNPVTALAAARALGQHPIVVVCGSMFLVGALRAYLLAEAIDPQITADPV